MKDFRKYVSLSVIMVFAVLFLIAGRVNASANFVLSFNSTNTVDNTTNTVANTTNTTQNVQLTTNTTANTTKVNNINSDASKDLPKTGENDVYIVTAIGVLALVIGGVAYAKSRKYDIR